MIDGEAPYTRFYFENIFLEFYLRILFAKNDYCGVCFYKALRITRKRFRSTFGESVSVGQSFHASPISN